MKQVKFLIGVFVALLLISCNQKKEIPDAEVTAIAKEAYIYGYPMVKNYSVMYASAIDTQGPNYKKPFNEFYMSSKIDTPVDDVKESVTNDTPLGSVWFDLRREPVILTVPEIEQGRYYSVQFTDLYSYNFDYVGTRTSGNKGGKFLIAGPDWTGEKPDGIERIIKSDTQFVYGLVRIQLLNADDIANIEKIQSGFMVQPLSEFSGTQAPAEVSPVNFPAYDESKVSTTEFFSYMNFVMQFVAEPKDEVDLLKRFAKVSIGPGKTFNLEGMEAKKPYQSGIDGAIADLDAAKKGDLIKVSDTHGTRAELKNNYMNRAYGAIVDLYGASSEEILSVVYKLDSEFKLLNGANKYAISFKKDQLPPTDAFWSLTLYDAQNQFLVENSIKRYYVNSAMVSKMVSDPEDGSVTLFIEKEAPTGEQMQIAAEAIKASMSVQQPNSNIVKENKSVDTKTVVKAPDVVTDKEPSKDVAAKAAKADVQEAKGVESDKNVGTLKSADGVNTATQKKVVTTPEAGSLMTNWLPTSDGDFYMVLRIYIPKENAINGTWKVPDVIRFDTAKAIAETPAESVDVATKPVSNVPDKAEEKTDTKVEAIGNVVSKPNAPASSEPVKTDAVSPQPVAPSTPEVPKEKVTTTPRQSPVVGTPSSSNKPKTVIINPIQPIPRATPQTPPANELPKSEPAQKS